MAKFVEIDADVNVTVKIAKADYDLLVEESLESGEDMDVIVADYLAVELDSLIRQGLAWTCTVDRVCEL